MKVNITYTIKAASDDFKLNTNYIRNFYFVEDLESMFMTAQLQVEDKGGWVEKLRITVNEIITSIVNKQLMLEKNKIKFDVEKTVEKINFTIPYWKPTTSIKYLSKIAKRSKSPQEAGFLFYSTLGPDDE